MSVLLLYGGVIVSAVFFLVVRAGPSLLKGKNIFRFHVLCLLLSILTNPLVVLLFSVLTILSFFLYTRWFVFKLDPKRLHKLIESSLSSVLIESTRTGGLYRLHLDRKTEAWLRVHRFFWACVMISFGGVRNAPRAAVFQRLFAKRFSPIYPRLIFHNH